MTTLTNLCFGMGFTSAASSLGTGSRTELCCLKRLSEPVASLRSLARIQPFCTNVSLPSGLISLMVASRSTSGVEDLTQSFTEPAPTTTVSSLSGAVTKDTALPDGFGFHFQSHCEAFPHSPPVPVLSP